MKFRIVTVPTVNATVLRGPSGPAGIISPVADGTIVGNVSGATAAPVGLTKPAIKTLLNFVEPSDLTWASINSKPLVFPPSAHSHPLSDLTGLGTGVATALAIAIGTSGGPVVKDGDIGTATGAQLTVSGNLYAGSTGAIFWTNRGGLLAPANGVVRHSNALQTSGVCLDANTADTLTIKNSANSAGGNLVLGAGSTASPSIRFGTDTNSGICQVAANTVSMVTAGAEVFRASAGNVVYTFANHVFYDKVFIGSTNDVNFTRQGLNTVQIGTTTNNALGSLACAGIASSSIDVQGVALAQSFQIRTGGSGLFKFLSGTNLFSPSDGILRVRDSSNLIGTLDIGNVTASGTVTVSQSTGNPTLNIANPGNSAADACARIGTASAGLWVAGANYAVRATAGNATTVPFTARGFASHSVNLIEAQTSTPTTVFSVGPTGTVNARNYTFTNPNNSETAEFGFLSGSTYLQVPKLWIGANSTNQIRLMNSTLNIEIFSGNTGYGTVVNGGGGAGARLGVNNTGNPSGWLDVRDSSYNQKLLVDSNGALITGTLGFSQSRFQQPSAQVLQTQCFDTSLAAWQETTRSQASPTGAKWSVFGATPIIQQTLPAAATDPATTQSLCNAIRSLLLNFGFSN